MKIGASQNSSLTFETKNLGIKNLYTEKLSADEAKELREQVQINAHAFTFNSFKAQNESSSLTSEFQKDYEEFQSFLKSIDYDGKPIASLSQDEAKTLVAEDGFFGVEQTAQRISDFVLQGAGENEDLLRAGREGVLRGFAQAEELWGETLPDISQETIKKALESIDMTMSNLGFSILDQEV